MTQSNAHLLPMSTVQIMGEGAAVLAGIVSMALLSPAGRRGATQLRSSTHPAVWAEQVTDEGVEVLAGMASMVVLNLTGCHSITPRGHARVCGLLDSPEGM